MANETLDYQLGRIDESLKQNDRAHGEILIILNKISCDLDTFKTKSSNDMSVIKGKASTWGAVTGFIVSAIMTVAGWLFLHINK